MAGRERLPVNGVELCVQTFGERTDPPILLIGGAASAMDFWETEFCEKLAAGGSSAGGLSAGGGLASGGRFVIRYDNRDTGESTSYPAGKPGYTGADLVTDAVGVLDALGLPRAHLAGVSMGGGIAQHIAVLHPGRVASLALFSTSPDGPGGADADDLPGPEDRIKALFEEPPADQPEPDWTDRAYVIDRFVTDFAAFAGSVTIEESRLRTLAGEVFDRTVDMAASQTNHWILEGGEHVRHRFGEITAPTLVLHGTEDPLLPYPHGEALAREIPGARLVPMPGVGHEFPPPQVWPLVIDELLAHTDPR